MIYEMLIYNCEQIETSIETSTQLANIKVQIANYWEEHGIHLLDAWTIVLNNTNYELYCLLIWESLGERQVKLSTIDVDIDLRQKYLLKNDMSLRSFMSIINVKPERLFSVIPYW